MARKVAVVAALLAAAAIVWATRWVALWEIKIAFRPFRLDHLTADAISASRLDWQDHLALGLVAWPPEGDGRSMEDWRLHELRTALASCPTKAGRVIHVSIVETAAGAAPYISGSLRDPSPEKFRASLDAALKKPWARPRLERLREAALAGQKADAGNAYFDTALAYVAFALGENEVATGYISSASRKRWRTYDAQRIAAIRRAMRRAGICIGSDPLFGLIEGVEGATNMTKELSGVEGAVVNVSVAYAEAARLADAERLARAAAALGKEIQDRAPFTFDGHNGGFLSLFAFGTARDLAIRYGSRDEIRKACNEADAARGGVASREERVARDVLPFWSRLMSWRPIGTALADFSASALRFVALLAVLLVACRARGIRLPRSAPVSSGVLKATLWFGLGPVVVSGIAGWYLDTPYPDSQGWGHWLRLLDLEAAWLWPFMLLLAVTVVSRPALSTFSRSLRAFLYLCGAGAAACAAWTAVWAMHHYAESAEDPFAWPPDLVTMPPLVLAGMGVVCALWVFWVLHRRRALLDEVESSRERRRHMLADFCWLASRLLIACIAVIVAGLLVHLLFLAWIGDQAAQVIRHGDASLLDLTRGRI
jgi:hypothetical protein